MINIERKTKMDLTDLGKDILNIFERFRRGFGIYLRRIADILSTTTSKIFATVDLMVLGGHLVCKRIGSGLVYYLK